MTVMWWDSKPSVHLHLDLPQTTLYLDPAIDLHNWRLWLGACYSLTWHCREADGEMYWTDCSSFCQEGMATSWQTGPEENSFAPNTTSAATSKSSLFIYSLSAELQIDMRANVSEVSVKKKRAKWTSGKQLSKMSSALLSPDDLKKWAACGLLANRPLNNPGYTEHLTEMRRPTDWHIHLSRYPSD